MATFVKVLKKHQAEIDRMIAEQEEGTPLSYSRMRDWGMLKPFSVRLPVPLIAVVEEMVNHGLWESKQEMVYDMIQSAYLDFIEASSETTKAKFRGVYDGAWKAWEAKHKDKLFDSRAGRWVAKDPAPAKSARQARK